MNAPDKMTLQATVEQDGSSPVGGMDRISWSAFFGWLARSLILAALIAAPWMIGSVNFWAQFWLATALLVALAIWWFDTAINKRSVQTLPYLALLLLVGILIGLTQIVPLSGFLGDVLLGRQKELYEQFTHVSPSVEAAASESSAVESSGQTLQRISLNTDGTWHHIRLLVMALAMMLLSCRYFRTPRDLTVFLGAMTLNGVALSIFGLIQKLTWNGQLYWSIPLQLGGTPFGPFVNRNNSGGYLLICLACAIGLMYLAMTVRKNSGPVPIISRDMPFWRQLSHQLLYFISELTPLKVAAMIAIVFITAGILATISRGAILSLLVAATATIFSYGVARRPKNLGVIMVPIMLTAGLLTVWLGFSEQIISRFENIDSAAEVSQWDARVQTWTDTWPSVAEMGKLGTGLGTYETVSKLYRTDPERSVYRYAENQYVQTLVEAGWLGLLVYLLAWGVGFYCAYFLLKIGQSPATVSAGLVGIFLLWSQAFASFFDFGFYIPANTMGMAATTGVIACFAHSMAYRLKQKSILRVQFPNSIVQVVVVLVFAACTMTSLDLNRKSRIDRLRAPRDLTFENLDIEATEELIVENGKLALNSSSVPALNELGRLWIHRARLQLFEQLRANDNSALGDTKRMQLLWDRTSLVGIQRDSQFAAELSRLSQVEFLRQPAIQVNLPKSRTWYEASLRLSPFQPHVQTVIGQLNSIVGTIDEARGYLERGVALAPSNIAVLRKAAVTYLQAGDFEGAAPHMKQLMHLQPTEFPLMLAMTEERMSSGNSQPDYDLILEEVLPDNPRLLYRFAAEFAPADSNTRKLALERAEILLEKQSQSDLTINVLKARIRLAMGDNESAIEYFRQAIINDPIDDKIRYELVQVLEAQQLYSEAIEETHTLIQSNKKNTTYRQMLTRLREKQALQQ